MIAALFWLSAGLAAAARANPSGSYSITCTGCAMSGTTLSCSCRDLSGGLVSTSRDVSGCDPNGDISNDNGQLVCTPKPAVSQTPSPTAPVPADPLPAGAQPTLINVTVPSAMAPNGWGANSVDFWQIPGSGDLFAGRVNLYPGTYDNGSPTWGLGLGQMDWKTYTLNYQRALLTPPAATGDGRRITTAYDPSVAYYNGEYWVAFECYGDRGWQGGAAATCLGPLDLKKGVDLSRTYVAVWGASYYHDDGKIDSASVPKLLVYQGGIWLYWSSVRIDATTGAWERVATRAVQLQQEADGLKRLWPWNPGSPGCLGGPIDANDPCTAEVWGPGADDQSNVVADAFQFWTDGAKVYALAGIGGAGCLLHVGVNLNAPGCYRLALAITGEPIGQVSDAFNADVVPDGVFPSNPQVYAHFISLPGGQVGILDAEYYSDGKGNWTPWLQIMTKTGSPGGGSPGPSGTGSSGGPHGPFTLQAGQSLTDTGLTLTMQSDGNFVLYNGSTPLWATGTDKMSCARCYATLQSDGNLVLYDPDLGEGSSGAYWSSHTEGHSDARLAIAHGSPHIQIVGASSVYWNSNP